ncbi:unnamed protein product [Dibothriocephalus latus]|uniref:Uncharacterized protein n=1 Tax=Dibothriocephalus latus TaxID=60516 RepID=A0A3P7LGC5_DIBLA|nr:unnamed protein product [Dibothriocephalus latus]
MLPELIKFVLLIIMQPALGESARLCCATNEAFSRIHGVQSPKSDCVADVIPWRHEFKPNSKRPHVDGRDMRFFSDYKVNNIPSNCNDDVGKRCFKEPGKKKVVEDPYGISTDTKSK